MDAKPQQPKVQEGAIAALNAAIDALNLTKISSVPSAKVVFGLVGLLLAMIRVCSLLLVSVCSRLTLNQDSIINELDYYVCRALERGVNGKKPNELSPSVYDAINQFKL